MSTSPITSTGPVVTLFESYGSGAEYVGRKVAAALGVDYIGQRFSSQELEDEATKAAAEEPDGGFMRFLKMFGQENLDHLDNRLIPSDQAGQHQTVLENNKFILDSTAKGGVILGRNGTVVLAENPKALHVKLDGPVDVRVARAAKAAGIDLERAHRRQVYEDQTRAAMSMRLYNWDPRKIDRYDLVINTAKFELDEVVQIILAAARAKASA